MSEFTTWVSRFNSHPLLFIVFILFIASLWPLLVAYLVLKLLIKFITLLSNKPSKRIAKRTRVHFNENSKKRLTSEEKLRQNQADIELQMKATRLEKKKQKKAEGKQSKQEIHVMCSRCKQLQPASNIKCKKCKNSLM